MLLAFYVWANTIAVAYNVVWGAIHAFESIPPVQPYDDSIYVTRSV